MDMSMFWIVAGFVVLLIDLWAIASVWRTTKTPATKLGWTVVILVFPVVGFAIWGIAGPRGIAEPPTSREHSKG